MPEVNFSLLSQDIIRTLVYYDLFQYPLKSGEVHHHLQSNHVSAEEVAHELDRLVRKGVLFQYGDLFGLRPDQGLAQRRIKGNEMAKLYFRIAERRARWIDRFPFVRAVMVSGSLSKQYADSNTDIDFFVVTSPGRLWLARTLLVVFKRIFLFNSHKYFCVNYFVDEEHLVIGEKNLFTATELVTLVPLRGQPVYQKLMEENLWARGYLPNAWPSFRNHKPVKTSGIKRWLEKWLGAGWGDYLEKKCFSLSVRRWRRLYADAMSPADFNISFKSNDHVSKNHPDNHQRKVMERYKRTLEDWAVRHSWKWSHE